MEHRCSLRHPADIKILIYKSGLPMLIGRLLDVSRRGLFIAAECDNMAINQLLEIEILGGRCEHHPHKRCRAMVAHVTGEGLGLAVDDDCEVSVELLSELVFSCMRRNTAFAELNGTAPAIAPAA